MGSRSDPAKGVQGVFAYRLLAEGTVEEKILELQASKRRLVEAVISEDAGGLASLTAKDLERLFA